MSNTLFKRQLKKKAKGLCVNSFCRNNHSKGRNICDKCISRRAKKNNPMGYRFNALRNNAKRRGKEFTLTFRLLL